MERTAIIAEKLLFQKNRLRNARKRLMHVVLSPDPEMIEEFLYSVNEEETVTFIPSGKRVIPADLIQRLREKAQDTYSILSEG